MWTLELMTEEHPPPALQVTGRILFIGRADSCDLAIDDEMVSGRHLAVWLDDGALAVEDLRSRNGTRLNGRRLDARAYPKPGDQLQLGTKTRFVIRQADEAAEAPSPRGLVMVDLAHGLRYRFQGDRFVFGSDPSADVLIAEAEPVSATVVAYSDGLLRLAVGEDARDVEVDEPFEVLGRHFKLVRPSASSTRTLEAKGRVHPYRVISSLDEEPGPAAHFEHLGNGHRHTVRSEVRASLLFQLCRKAQQDMAQGTPIAHVGWMGDGELATGIWGRTGSANPTSHLGVVLWRLRKELEAHGFDPACLEKRNRFLRLAVEQAEIR